MHGVAFPEHPYQACAAQGCRNPVEYGVLCHRCYRVKKKLVPQVAYRTDKYGRRIG